MAACGRGGYSKRELGDGSFEIRNADGRFRYLSAEKAKESGIGIRIQKDVDGLQVVIEIFPGSPASSSGLKVGDRVLSAGGHKLKGLEVHQAAEFIKGPPGSMLELACERRGEPMKLKIYRAKDVMRFTDYPSGITIRNFPTKDFPNGTCASEKSPACHFLIQSGEACFYSCPLGS